MSRRSLCSCSTLNHGCKPWERITTLKEVSQSFDIPWREHHIQQGSKKVESLTAEKIHWSHGFQKYHCRRCHAAPDDRIGHLLKQRRLLDGQRLPFRLYSKGVPDARPNTADFLREIAFKTRCHRAAKAEMPNVKPLYGRVRGESIHGKEPLATVTHGFSIHDEQIPVALHGMNFVPEGLIRHDESRGPVLRL